jgi:AbrB family looped-hinge helix DNA binding protein
VGKYGRIVLPKDVRERYGVTESTRFIIREREGEIVLIPVRRYKNPTQALFGSIAVEAPIDDPKKVAREHQRKRLIEEHEL